MPSGRHRRKRRNENVPACDGSDGRWVGWMGRLGFWCADEVVLAAAGAPLARPITIATVEHRIHSNNE